jgi:chorismate mutase
MAYRAIRGATQLERDERDHLLRRTAELITKVMHDNDIHASQLISIYFSATQDIHSEFPALAARELGLGDVPLMCGIEMDVKGAMPRVIRLMLTCDIDAPRSEIKHIYLRGAEALRLDLAQ